MFLHQVDHRPARGVVVEVVERVHRVQLRGDRVVETVATGQVPVLAHEVRQEVDARRRRVRGWVEETEVG